jgi:predicted ribosomally synthesized peptide with SipW-like signal peptide
MKKVLISLSIIGAVAAIAIGATVAYLSDTETSTGNTFTAGTLDLKVGGKDDTEVVHIVLDNIKPGWSREYRWTIKNAGTLDGILWFEVTNIVNKDNGVIEPEQGAPGEDGTELGELGANMTHKINFFRPGTYFDASRPRDGSRTGPEIKHWISLNSLAGHKWYYQDILKSGEEEEKDLCIVLKLDSSVGNCIQGDSVSFDIVFHLDQVTP